MKSPASGSAVAGIVCVLVAVACFGMLDTTTQIVGAAVPVFMALWARYLVQATATTGIALPLRGMAALRTRHPRFQLLRGLLLLTTSVLSFFSLRNMPVADFTAIVMTTPLVITVVAALVLKERVSLLRWSLVAGGFAGVVVILRPGGEIFGWAALLPFTLVAFNAWFQVLTSRMARTEDPLTMHLYTGWACLLATTALVPFAWVSLPDPRLWLGLCLMGLLGAVGHFLLIVAYRRAAASTVTPFLYAQIGFAMLGGWLAFGHAPDGWSLLGMLLIAVCGAFSAWLTAREGGVRVLSTES